MNQPNLSASQVSGKGQWSQNIGDEALFWRHWFSSAEFELARTQRVRLLEGIYPESFHLEVGALHGELVRVLDVGSGPVSTLPLRAPQNPVQLVCVDALADIYNQLLDEYGYRKCPRIVKARGEELVARFGPKSFHYVHIANALDHCEDPAATLEQMVEVCAPGGMVIVISIENEGVREQYSGLHQWNLEPSDDGVYLWNPSRRENLLDRIRDQVRFEWRYVDHGQTGFRIFEVRLRKR